VVFERRSKMNQKVWGILAVLLVGSLPQLGIADGGINRGTLKTITGEAVDVHCYVEAGGKDREYRDCLKQSLGKGFPIGILEKKTGHIYLAVIHHPELNGKHGEFEPANALLEPHMGLQLKVTGIVATSEDMHMIAIQRLEPSHTP
jgi:hypothetical protein